MRYKTYDFYKKEASEEKSKKKQKKANGRNCREHEYIHIYKHKTDEFRKADSIIVF